jgi:hypothetical protein
MTEPLLRKLTPSSRNQLRALIEGAFTLDELQLLCADLGVDFENLGGGMKSVRVLNLVTMMERHNRPTDLVDRCMALRPAIAWQADYEVAATAQAQSTRTAHETDQPNAQDRPRADLRVSKAPVASDAIAADREMVMIAGSGLATSSFQIDIYPVTNLAFSRFLERNTAAEAPSGWRQRRYEPGTERHPVVGVSFAAAEAFARWAGKRLPTVREWLAAAGSTDAFPWGVDFDPSHANCERARGGTTPVDAYPSGVSAHGVFDLAGNVWEWTTDEVAPRGLSKGRTKRVLKGGSWRSPRQQLLCSADIALWPEIAQDDVGFRCVV